MGREHQPAVLLSIGHLLGREVRLDHFLRDLVNRIVTELAADRGTLFLIDPARRELFSHAGTLPELKEIRLKMGQGVAGAVAESGNLINVADVSAESRFYREVDKRTGYRTRSILAAPIRDRLGHVLGVVQLLNAKRGAFSADDEAHLGRLCAEAAVAIENTSLWPLLRPNAPGPATVAYRYNHIVGDSDAMHAVYRLIDKAASTDATVLIRGESGTGKEQFARAIHFNSSRRERPFVKVDCTALPPGLIENELFGHERGAYTGADSSSRGKLEAAQGGTLFLDEIAELPISLQAKLLRFIQDRAFERVGGTRVLQADVRLLVATHRDLEGMVGRSEFREDLYYRVKVLQLTLPPLRERGASDILALAAHFTEVYQRKHRKAAATLSEAARVRLVQHSWPGNVRELEHCIESAVVLSDGTIEPEHLSLPHDKRPSKQRWVPQPLAEVEREHIARVLEYAEQNRSLCAKLLNIGRNTLLRKLKQYRLA